LRLISGEEDASEGTRDWFPCDQKYSSGAHPTVIRKVGAR
jgi:hypothetical protein